MTVAALAIAHCIGDSRRCCISDYLALAIADFGGSATAVNSCVVPHSLYINQQYNGRVRVDWTLVPSGLSDSRCVTVCARAVV